MPGVGWIARVVLCLLAGLAAGPTAAQDSQRLSSWLLRNANPDSYFPGVSWLVPGEELAQHALKSDVVGGLSSRSAPSSLREWVSSLPVTGRVPVVFADPRWLMSHPNRDPVLLAGHKVVLPPRPRTVTVVTENGDRCSVLHSSDREAMAYVEACSAAQSLAADWAWIVQPDGRVERYGVAAWNRERQDEPAPGAWIWAPSRRAGYPDRLSDSLARFLATQGPAPDPLDGAMALAPTAASAFSTRSRTMSYYSSDWGETGLLQTPTARIRPAGTVSLSITHVWPYTRGNVFVSPFDWMEAGFRYTDIANRLYGLPEVSGNQPYKDKSFDFKFRLVRESAYIPQIAVGIRDIAGTGIFSGEYVVANKRFGPLDWSLGLGWGYVGGRSDLRNPLSAFSSSFDTRQLDVGLGGSLSPKAYFHGPTALFGGLQYQTPWDRLVLRLEREGNDYQHEPFINSVERSNLPQRTPWNFGLTYRISSTIHLTAGVERGNRLLAGVAFSGNLAESSTPKLGDAPRVRYSASEITATDWSTTIAELRRQTGWQVQSIERQGPDLRVTVLDPEGLYWAYRLDRATAVLNRDAPSSVDRFIFLYRQRGMETAEHVIVRNVWVAQESRPVPPHERVESVLARAPQRSDKSTALASTKRRRLEHGLGPDLQYTLGGPDAFALYQLGVAERLRFWITDDTWLRGKFRLGLTNNYDRYKTTGPSDLPRVRTHLREYQTTSRFTMNYMQLTHAGRITDNQYFSLYGGYFEEMFGGVGGEWLYRPFGGKTALGVDVNYARQRDFEQDLSFMDYQVITGHTTLYLDTGVHDVLAMLSAGRYLAGDVGVTGQLTKTFRNGVTMGAFATKTNVSAQQFGEGSFDKGVFLTIPFDALFTRSTPGIAQVMWKPLTRDGGAKLLRQEQLYNMSNARDYRTLWYKPAEKPDDISISR
jgi:hypothetical protein